jgi:hypothetical protein
MRSSVCFLFIYHLLPQAYVCGVFTLAFWDAPNTQPHLDKSPSVKDFYLSYTICA